MATRSTSSNALRQHARTALLMGVDFLPVSSRAPEAVQEAPRGQPPIIEVEVKAAVAPAPEAPVGGKQALLDDLKRRHDAQCAHCTVAPPFTQTVFGEGDPDAGLMFIGEAPGAEEDKTGRPFVGRAGEKLNDMIRAMGLAREDVYIANILKARPPNNATPTPDESERCGVWLREQIRIIHPRVIVTLGKPAANYMLNNRDAMGSLRGVWHEYRDDTLVIPLMPTFHPAYLLRAYTPENRKKVWSDLKAAMERLQEGKRQ
ncbi:MAG: uracil-DNA glycosylase [Phycisphaeraceae bacterium]|nr:uracil-DNA glycosylase [Phycisphaeraceae bacterium]